MTTDSLGRARERCRARAWREAFELLSAVDRDMRLTGDDLELLATSAYMLGDEPQYLTSLARAHRAHLESEETRSALRCAFWIAVQFAERDEFAQASGWRRRAERLLAELGNEAGSERGYLLIPRIFELEAAGDLGGAAATAGEAVGIARRFDDRELFALAAHLQGHILCEAGRVSEGLPLLDEAMVEAATGELSPVVTGIVYCGVILACQSARDIRRAREWTAALSQWCAGQADLVAFAGRCRVHRAEIMHLEGAWDEALEETQIAEQRSLQAGNEAAAGEALYRRAEILRLRGKHRAAEEAYRRASGLGRDPQPGLALLRLAEGQVEAGLGAIRRALAETGPASEAAVLLPAAIELALAADDLEAARADVARLAEAMDPGECYAVDATLAHVRGAVELAADNPAAGLRSLRFAVETWQALGAPYEVARARELAGLACRSLGDAEGAAFELRAALETFELLGAVPDRVRLGTVAGRSASGGEHELTERELQVLRLVASGKTNKAIAAELVLSERTIDRHVSNIFTKLGVSSRAAATSHAYDHGLI